VRGHAAGDDVLQQFAARAQKSIRTNSDWVARYGGEEFLIVLPETAYTGAMHVAEKIRQLIAATPFPTRTGEAPVTVSVGVASTGPSGPDIMLKTEAMIRCADECLYRSKQEGRDRSTGLEILISHPISAAG
jgi:two-component system cell cycle response regulator